MIAQTLAERPWSPLLYPTMVAAPHAFNFEHAFDTANACMGDMSSSQQSDDSVVCFTQASAIQRCSSASSVSSGRPTSDHSRKVRPWADALLHPPPVTRNELLYSISFAIG